MVGFVCGSNLLDLKSELRQFKKNDDEKSDNISKIKVFLMQEEIIQESIRFYVMVKRSDIHYS